MLESDRAQSVTWLQDVTLPELSEWLWRIAHDDDPHPVVFDGRSDWPSQLQSYFHELAVPAQSRLRSATIYALQMWRYEPNNPTSLEALRRLILVTAWIRAATAVPLLLQRLSSRSIPAREMLANGSRVGDYALAAVLGFLPLAPRDSFSPGDRQVQGLLEDLYYDPLFRPFRRTLFLSLAINSHSAFPTYLSTLFSHDQLDDPAATVLAKNFARALTLPSISHHYAAIVAPDIRARFIQWLERANIFIETSSEQFDGRDDLAITEPDILFYRVN